MSFGGSDAPDDDGLDLEAPPIVVRGLESRFGAHIVHQNLDLTIP